MLLFIATGAIEQKKKAKYQQHTYAAYWSMEF